MRNKKFEKLCKELEFLMRSSREPDGGRNGPDSRRLTPGFSIILIDREFRVRFFNDASGAISRIFSGRKLETGCQVFENIPEREAGYLREGFIRAFQGDTVSGERAIDIPGGSKHWFTLDFSPVFSRERDIDGACLTLNNITAEKRAEASLGNDQGEMARRDSYLASQNSFMRALLDAIPVPVFFKDRNCRYLGCNKAFTLLMGVESEDIKGKKSQEIWPEEFSSVYEKKDLELLRDQVTQEYEFKVKDRIGLIRDVIYCKNVFFDEEGKAAGIVGSLTEITERKKAEEVLSKVNPRARAMEGFIPICAGCKRIHDREQEGNPWIQPEAFIGKRLPNIKFTHGMCPECMKRWYPDIGK